MIRLSARTHLTAGRTGWTVRIRQVRPAANELATALGCIAAGVVLAALLTVARLMIGG